MGNKNKKADRIGYHECEMFKGGMPEAAESESKWSTCTKNPGHGNFISAQVFKEKILPKIQDVASRETLRSRVDLTVRLRVHYTSAERPDDDQFSQGRGLFHLRTGTGFIEDVDRPESNEPCPCDECGGKITKRNWRITIRTAHHVVYNTEEAKETKVDLFLDDEKCDRNGTMKSVWGEKVLGCGPEWDSCYLSCVTCDEDLGERIESAMQCYTHRLRNINLSGLESLQLPCESDCVSGMIVSHPHGQPKKISVGQVSVFRKNGWVNHNVPTCPGSSGAPMFRFESIRETGAFDCCDFLILPPVHSGRYSKTPTGQQLNYGFEW